MDSSSKVEELKGAGEQENQGQARDTSGDINDEYSRQSKKELFASLDKLREGINSSRGALNRADSEKELWYSKKEEFYSAIGKKIEHIKEGRKKRDGLTREVKELKEKRTAFNDELKKKIAALVKLNDEAKNLTKIQENRRFSGHRKSSAFPRESRIKGPSQIKKDIDAMESKLETEVMPFEKEKELSKKIKALKKSLGEASALMEVIGSIKKLNSEISAARKNNDEIHRKIQNLARESQDIHETIIRGSKEIDELKAKEEEAFKNFSESKKRFNAANHDLKNKLGRMNYIRGAIDKFKLEEDEKRKLENEKIKLKEVLIIKTKEQEIEEKIKSRKKLTTEDFLAFQEAIKGRDIGQ